MSSLPVLHAPAVTGSVAERKTAWRSLVRRVRRDLVEGQGQAGRAAQAARLRDAGLRWVRGYAIHAGRPSLAGLRVSAYASLRTEPPVDALVAALVEAGVEVLLPITLPAGRLDWHRAGDPVAQPLGARALAAVDVALVPALAVDASGLRLGQGGGYFDRALGDLPGTTPTIAVLHDHERVPELPGEPHDVRVELTLTAADGVESVGPVGAR